MTIRRRDFLKSLVAATALASLGRPSFAQPGRRVGLGLLLDPDTPEGRGASLGLDEAHRVGELLHVEISAGPTSEFALIGLAAPQEPKTLFLETAPQATPQGWNVTSSPAFRQQALDRFKGKDLRVSDWHAGLMKFGAEELNVRFHRRFGQPMDERSWHGWIAVKCAVELALRYPAGNPREQIASLSLDGHKGMLLNFDPRDRHLIQPVYLIDAQGKLVEQVEPE
ncbi:MAG TPA: hypothetical protein VH988_23145 [Thermoanaerobaculia bacterium]|jgi:hypothetical protein|nr:hypothetical protein [Thermoanaerobaculia bacterium]